MEDFNRRTKNRQHSSEQPRNL